MNGLPYYRAYPRDFIEGTVGMSFELKGAYRLVLDLIYMQGGQLPDDARYISGLLGCSVRAWNRYRSQLLEMGKIYASENVISNFRADKELESLSSFQVRQSQNRRGSLKNKDLEKPRSDHTDTDTYIRDDDDVARVPARADLRVVNGDGDRRSPEDRLYDSAIGALGFDRGTIPPYWQMPTAGLELVRFRQLGLSDAEIIEVIRASAKHPSGPPRGPRILEGAMKRLAAAKTAPPLSPGEPDRPVSPARSRVNFDNFKEEDGY